EFARLIARSPLPPPRSDGLWRPAKDRAFYRDSSTERGKISLLYLLASERLWTGHDNSAGRGDRHYVGDRWSCRVQQRAARQRIRVIPDVPRICALQHGNAGIVVHGDDTNRYASEYLAHDGGMP